MVTPCGTRTSGAPAEQSPAGEARAAHLPSAIGARALQKRLLDWYAENRRDLPWRRTTDPYAILVSEVMLQQTQVPRVVPRFYDWLAAWPDLEGLAAAPLADVLQRWQGLGYNNRAQRLQACAQAAMAEAEPGARAELPRTPQGLRALPGVGPYTARAVLIFAHNADLAAVDANVRRVLTHELDLPEDLGEKDLQAVADAVLPHGRSRDWHNALMDYGSLVLTARSTGIASLSRQGAFEGSRRQKRARLLRRLLDHGPQQLADVSAALDLPLTEAADVLARLARDGLVVETAGVWEVA
jgi:A/G-specific adenine glycosylase